MIGSQNPTGYSASVRLWLHCDGKSVPLSHTSSTFVIAREPVELPAGKAQIVFTIDDARYERNVQLVNGMTRSCREVMVIADDDISPF